MVPYVGDAAKAPRTAKGIGKISNAIKNIGSTGDAGAIVTKQLPSKMMENYWIKNVYSAIKDISDLSFQKEVWLGKSDKWVSSFNEMINTLYDDNCFEDFINSEEWSKLDSHSDLHQEMVVLRDIRTFALAITEQG